MINATDRGVITSQPFSTPGLDGGVHRQAHRDTPAGVVTSQPNTNTNAVPEPKNLRDLASLEALFIKQNLELIEAITCCETRNSYDLYNKSGNKVFQAQERTCFCTRACCGDVRPFTIEVKDLQDNIVMVLHRPLRFSTCFCPCFLQKLTVESPKGQRVGGVRQLWSCYRPRFQVEDEEEDPVFIIRGPICQWKCCGDIKFKIASLDEENFVGVISKQWSGILREVFTDTDNFGVSFPPNVNTKLKASILGAVFLIDFMYFEDNRPQLDSLVPSV